jgi:hypothetical protein
VRNKKRKTGPAGRRNKQPQKGNYPTKEQFNELYSALGGIRDAGRAAAQRGEMLDEHSVSREEGEAIEKKAMHLIGTMLAGR